MGCSGFEDAVDLMEEFSQDGDDDLFGILAACDESNCESSEEGIEDSGVPGRHEEGSP